MEKTEHQKYLDSHGITSKTVDTVLPSGGRGFSVAWYQRGVLMPRGLAGWALDRQAERAAMAS